MGTDVIAGIVILVVVLVLEMIAFPFLDRLGLHLKTQQLGTKLVVAFLAGFIFFILFTDRMPGPGQKIPLIAVTLLLIWANLFLKVGKKESPEGE
jgi:uncharacterized membrane protein